MKMFKEVIEINEVMSMYDGGDCRLHLFCPSLWRVILRISSSSQKESLFVLLASGDSFYGKLKWSNIQIRLEKKQEEVYTVFTLEDKLNGNRVNCDGGVIAVQGIDIEFGDCNEFLPTAL